MKMQDVDDDLPCPIIVCTAVQLLFHGSLSETVDLNDLQETLCHRVRKRSPDLLRQIAHFLTRPRSAEARRRLATLPTPEPGLCLCTRTPLLWSDPFVRDLHALEHLKPGMRPIFVSPSTLEMILPFLFAALGNTVNSVFGGRSQRKVVQLAQAAVRRGRIVPWPSCQSDVLPYGIVPSMSALCAWAEIFADTPVLRTAILIYECILTPAFPSVFVQTIMPHAFLPIAAAYNTKCARALAGNGQSQRGIEGPLQCFLILLARVSLDKIAVLSDDEILAATGDDLRYVESLQGLCAQICPVLDRMLQNNMLTARRVLEDACAAFSPAALRLRLLCCSRHMNFQNKSPLIPYAKFAAKGIVCARPECERTHFAAGAPLRRCGARGMAYYCSKSCQASAWRHPALPHKEVCGTLRRVFELHDGCDGDRSVVNDELRRLKVESGVNVLDHLERLYSGRWAEMTQIVNETKTLSMN